MHLIICCLFLPCYIVYVRAASLSAPVLSKLALALRKALAFLATFAFLAVLAFLTILATFACMPSFAFVFFPPFAFVRRCFSSVSTFYVCRSVGLPRDDSATLYPLPRDASAT